MPRDGICLMASVCVLTASACSVNDQPESLSYEMTIDPPKPILEGYTADPHAVVFDGTYYVYPTSDKDQWLTTDFSAWSSKDLIHWQNEGLVLDVAHDLHWATVRAWAPAMVRRDGK